MTSDRIEERLADVRGRVARAAARADRDPEIIELLPVTKGHPVAGIEAVAAAGLTRIGENRVPEAAEKQLALEGRAGLVWHMIGRLQRNKTRKAVELFDVIESVDSLKLARAISRVVEEEGRSPIGVLAQVNASGEPQKAGFGLEELGVALTEVCELPGLRVDGLMTMAPFTADEDVLRSTFGRVREASDRARDTIAAFQGEVLSMGMSSDFEIAIEQGSTRVRLGTVLLGER